MVFEGDQIGSGHKPVVLTIEGISIKTPAQPRLREVWRLDKIPTPPKDRLVVGNRLQQPLQALDQQDG